MALRLLSVGSAIYPTPHLISPSPSPFFFKGKGTHVTLSPLSAPHNDLILRHSPLPARLCRSGSIGDPTDHPDSFSMTSEATVEDRV